MNKIIQFGEEVPGFNIRVLNEREIRAAAGILFIIMFISVLTAVLKGDFLMIKYSVTIFLTDILIRVFVNPKFSPALIIGRLMVGSQVPEYVGAPQKKFAWTIGVLLSAAAFTLLVLVNSYSPVTGIICLICLIFLFFEAAFGICLGCIFYDLFHKEKAQYCPGEVCEVQVKQDIQRTSAVQVLILAGFIACIFLAVILFKDSFSKQPHNLFKTENTSLSEQK